MKKYNKQFNEDKSLLPHIYHLIAGIDNKYIFSEKYSLRHPGAILNRATKGLLFAYKEFLEEYQIFIESRQADEKSYPIKLLYRLSTLISQLDSLQDKCFIILKTFCKPPEKDVAADRKFVQEWLKKNGFNIVNSFLDYSGEIHNLINYFNDRLKHDDFMFNFVSMNIDGRHVYGFHGETLRGKEVKKIYKIIPSSHEDKVIGISFNYFIRVLLLCYFHLCDGLEFAIKKHLKDKYNYQPKLILKEKNPQELAKVLNFIAQEDELFFPYEHKEFLRVKKSGKIFAIQYPRGDKFPYKEKLQLAQQMFGDGYTKTFNLCSI